MVLPKSTITDVHFGTPYLHASTSLAVTQHSSLKHALGFLSSAQQAISERRLFLKIAERDNETDGIKRDLAEATHTSVMPTSIFEHL
jgi:hypothetical protein